MATRNSESKAKSTPTPRRSQAAVPPASRAATARKLEIAPDDFSLEFEADVATTSKLSSAEIEARQLERQRMIEIFITKRDEYVDRLDTGAAKIEEARAQGKDVSEWEDYWIYLLRRYEEICDKLRDAYVAA